MFGNRRLAKRSIVGSNVCALAANGCFYPSVIESTTSWPDCLDSYRVRFKEGPYIRTDVSAKEIVGPGFCTVGEISLIAGQKVFLTQNGREVPGVLTSDRADDKRSVCVLVSAAEFGEEELLQRRNDDVRLMASRKSARLQTNETNYSRLADLHPENKKRPVSNVIDVPVKSRRKHHHAGHHHHHHQHHQHQTANSRHQRNRYERTAGVNGLGGWTTDAMDEQTAALVLTSLSCSPPPPSTTTAAATAAGLNCNMGAARGRQGTAWTPGSHGSSGRASSSASSTSSPSPPPVTSVPVFTQRSRNSEIDEMDDAKKETIFQCTWPGCDEQKKSCPMMEKHVRLSHLGKRDCSDSESDHEEEFYYKEIEVCIDTMTRSFADMNTEPMSISDGEIDVEGGSIDDDVEERRPQHHASLSDSDADEFTDVASTGASTATANNNNNTNTKNRHCAHRTTGSNGYRTSASSNNNNDHRIREAIRDAMNDYDDATPTSAIYCQSVNADHDYQKKNTSSAPLTIPSRRHSDDQISPLTSRQCYADVTEGYERLSKSSQHSVSTRMRMSTSPQHKLSCGSLPSRFPSGAICPGAGGGGGGGASCSPGGGAGAATSSMMSSPCRRSRLEVKKCRKVYGMEKRESWCTQCKWKKACTRFHE